MSTVELQNVVIGIACLLSGALFSGRPSLMAKPEQRAEHTYHEVQTEGPTKVVCNVTCVYERSEPIITSSSIFLFGFILGSVVTTSIFGCWRYRPLQRLDHVGHENLEITRAVAAPSEIGKGHNKPAYGGKTGVHQSALANY